MPLVVLEELDGLKKAEEEKPVVLVTKDLVLRLKAQISELKPRIQHRAGHRRRGTVQRQTDLLCGGRQVSKNSRKKGVHLKELYLSDEDGNKIQPELTENEFIILKADQSVKKTHLGRVEGKKVVSLEFRESVLY